MKKKTARRHNYSLIAGLILTGLLVAVILIGTIWTPYDPNAMSAGEKLLAPSLSHPFGTDNFGRDIFSRVLEGARTTLFIGVCTVAIGTLFGVLSLSTIKNIVSSLGLDEAWWTNITVAAMICLFLVVQSLVLSRKNKNEN